MLNLLLSFAAGLIVGGAVIWLYRKNLTSAGARIVTVPKGTLDKISKVSPHAADLVSKASQGAVSIVEKSGK